MGVRGFGATVEGAAAGELGSVRDINGMGKSAGKIDYTSGASKDANNNPLAIGVAGIIEGKPINVTLLYTKVAYLAAVNAVGPDENDTFTITFADNSTYVTAGYISDVSGVAPYQGEMTFTVTIQPSGDVTFT